MALTSSQLDALIESARLALQTALVSPKINYTLGGKSVNYFEYINYLRIQLEELSSLQSAIPSEQVRAFDSDITSVGDDNTELEGDETE